MIDFILTPHARRRMNERGITMETLLLVVQYGQRIWGKDTLFIFMGRRQACRFGKLAEQLEGIVLVIESRTRELKTVFRNRQWTRKIKHKKIRRHKPVRWL